MRKYIKKQICEVLETMIKSLDAIELLFKNEDSSLYEVLEGQQSAAIAIGTELENCEDETQEIVNLLEKYCEGLWELSQKPTKNLGLKKVQDLRTILRNVFNAVLGLKSKTEIVFLPYKASMWDCMETVWQAAMKDIECAVYVIPVPYYDRNEDGQFGECHYEAELFPKEVEITSYKEYSLEENHPDIIYIHNPYDEYNLVTSIMPDFYSSVIRDYTEKLVYIPYFSTGGAMPESHNELPVYYYADYVIAESDVMKEKLCEANQDVQAEKILPLGSPKIERILKLQKLRDEIVETKISETWKKKIDNKKVVLYNTSLSGLLEESQQFMKKVRFVLSQFEGRNNVVLMWRPHPLMEATLLAMRPKLYAEYLELKEQFINSSYGIFDDTSDPTISAVVADAYMGERTSSMVQYFGVQGKPVFFTDWEYNEENNQDRIEAVNLQRRVFFTDFYFEDGDMWFVPRSGYAYNYLCKMNVSTGAVKRVCELPGELYNQTKGNAYFGILKMGNKVVLSPVWSSDIYILNVVSGQAIKVPLLEKEVQANFAKIYEYEGKAYLQPRNYPAVIELDVNTGECIYYATPNRKAATDISKILFGIGAAVYKGKMYIPCVDRNGFLIFDLKNKTFEEKTIEGIESGIYNVTLSGNELWCVGCVSAMVVRWNLDTDKMYVWNEFPIAHLENKQYFREIADDGDRILVFPESYYQVLAIDKTSGEIVVPVQESFFGKEHVQKETVDTPHLVAKELENKIYIMRYFELCIYDKTTRTGQTVKCQLSLYDYEKSKIDAVHLCYARCVTPNQMSESQWWSVSEFLNYMETDRYQYHSKVQNNYRTKIKNFDDACGEKIHNTIKEG